jgi:hypothetical protein
VKRGFVDASGSRISTFYNREIPKTQLWEKYSCVRKYSYLILDQILLLPLLFVLIKIQMAMMLPLMILECINYLKRITQKDFPIEVPTGKAFEAQIAGSKT